MIKHQYLILLAVCLTACGDTSRIADPNTYKKCSEYSTHYERNIVWDMVTDTMSEDTTWVMTYDGRSVSLTDAQAKRLDTDPTGVCKEVM